MATPDILAAEQALAQILATEARGDPPWATAKVIAVAGGGRLTLEFRGATVANIPHLASYTGTVGDVVCVLHGWGQILVLGKQE
ncbi:hypothetical protein [Frankia sp. Cj3]|uniref:hypothetical protein n=1 Tax=Frankia sp. Cj3 TaxID=2880976 RepID=UPI001EF46E8C|nr:hypothetical protein [Frankia sp. Cj3]